MIRPEQIPDEVVEAAAIERWGINEPTQWELETSRIIIAAALNAWETPMHRGIIGVGMDEVGSTYPAIILPLPPKEGE